MLICWNKMFWEELQILTNIFKSLFSCYFWNFKAKYKVNILLISCFHFRKFVCVFESTIVEKIIMWACGLFFFNIFFPFISCIFRYVGEFITGSEATQRDDDTYFFDLESKVCLWYSCIVKINSVVKLLPQCELLWQR